MVRRWQIFASSIFSEPQAIGPIMRKKTCTENFIKFGHVVFLRSERTDIQTDRHAYRNTLHPAGGKVMTSG